MWQYYVYNVFYTGIIIIFFLFLFVLGWFILQHSTHNLQFVRWKQYILINYTCIFIYNIRWLFSSPVELSSIQHETNQWQIFRCLHLGVQDWYNLTTYPLPAKTKQMISMPVIANYEVHSQLQFTISFNL